MGKLRRSSTHDAEHSGLEQTLVRLYETTYRAGRRLHLPPEDSKDAAMLVLWDFLIEWGHADAARAAEQVPGNTPVLSEEEVSTRDNAGAHDYARKYWRDRDHRASPAGSEIERTQAFADLADPHASPQAELEERELLEAITTILATLSAKAGTQFWEHHVGQVSFAELGRRHGCTPEGIRQRLQRAVPHIREELIRCGWDETGST